MSDNSLWTLLRDDAGYFLRFHDGSLQRLGDQPGWGDVLSVAWCLGMPGPSTAAEAQQILARNKEVLEMEALDWLAVRVGARGPIPMEV